MKKAWSKPELNKVKLIPEEVMTANCKTNTVTGGPSLTPCYIAPSNKCSAAGS